MAQTGDDAFGPAYCRFLGALLLARLLLAAPSSFTSR